MPFFTVIIPTYNRAHIVGRAIISVLLQTFTDFECIVIDDGSTDSIEDVLSLYANTIKYIRVEHGGVSRARNTGITMAQGSWIAFLDSDDVWRKTKLQEQYEYIISHPDIYIHQTDETWIRKGRVVNPQTRHIKREGFIFEDSLHLCLISPSAVVVHKSVFENVGLFDERLTVCEDYDMWLRIAWQYHVGLLPHKLVVKFGGHGDQLSRALWGMDRFRVYAICKLLQHYGTKLPDEYYTKAINVALQKCDILANGAKKRSNMQLLQKIEKVKHWLTVDRQSMQAYPDLLEEQLNLIVSCQEMVLQ